MATSAKASGKNGRLSFGKIKEPLEVPNLLDLQIESFDWLMGNEKWQARVKTALDAGRTDVPTTSGLTEIFEEISPIEDLARDMFRYSQLHLAIYYLDLKIYLKIQFVMETLHRKHVSLKNVLRQLKLFLEANHCCVIHLVFQLNLANLSY